MKRGGPPAVSIFRRTGAFKLNPYLGFSGNAREAMTFYASTFGGTPEFMTFGDMGQTGESKDLVMHSSLVTGADYTLFASDTPPGMKGRRNGQISISGDDSAELKGYWDKLADGADVEVPLDRQPSVTNTATSSTSTASCGWVNLAGEGNQG